MRSPRTVAAAMMTAAAFGLVLVGGSTATAYEGSDSEAVAQSEVPWTKTPPDLEELLGLLPLPETEVPWT